MQPQEQQAAVLGVSIRAAAAMAEGLAVILLHVGVLLLELAASTCHATTRAASSSIS
jgi:type IV secretory pathway VirB3-like protein